MATDPPTDADYEEFFEDACRNKVHGDQYSEFLRQRFPERRDRKAYYEWGCRELRLKNQRDDDVVSHTDFAAHVDNMSFYDKAAVGTLTTSSALYLTLSPCFAERGDAKYSEGILTDCNFLGVNLPVSVSRRKDQHFPSDESTTGGGGPSSTPIVHKTVPGFVFHQLGVLQYMDNDDEMGVPATNDEAAERPWMATGYVLVARIVPDDGRIDGVYAIYDIHQQHYDDDYSESGISPSSRRMAVEDDCPDLRFTCARLRVRLEGSRFGMTMEWSEVVTAPVELVRMLRFSRGPLERVHTRASVERVEK
ncbi:hypothetical protein SLS58_002903 [Diplodia intermedia]|uniref:Uncharacterized protein n=1 Tax=Diplodia intermedia TaxID=856260 RepID=A0ABR3TY05_9PEZI